MRGHGCVLYVGKGRWLEEAGTALEPVCGVAWCEGSEKALGRLPRSWCGVVLYEVASSHDRAGRELARLKAGLGDEIAVVAMGQGEGLETERAVRAAGIFYYLIVPADPVELRDVVRSAVSYTRRRAGRFARRPGKEGTA